MLFAEVKGEVFASQPAQQSIISQKIAAMHARYLRGMALRAPRGGGGGAADRGGLGRYDFPQDEFPLPLSSRSEGFLLREFAL